MVDFNEELKKLVNNLVEQKAKSSQEREALEKQEKQKIIKKILKQREEILEKQNILSTIYTDINFRFNFRDFSEIVPKFRHTWNYDRVPDNYLYITTKGCITDPEYHFGIDCSYGGIEFDDEHLQEKSYNRVKDYYDYIVNQVRPFFDCKIIELLKEYNDSIEKDNDKIKELQAQKEEE